MQENLAIQTDNDTSPIKVQTNRTELPFLSPSIKPLVEKEVINETQGDIKIEETVIDDSPIKVQMHKADLLSPSSSVQPLIKKEFISASKADIKIEDTSDSKNA